jgi:hypothetical protein
MMITGAHTINLLAGLFTCEPLHLVGGTEHLAVASSDSRLALAAPPQSSDNSCASTVIEKGLLH